MDEPVIVGWDTSSKLTGWCAGPGDRLPVAGAFPTDQHGAKLGPLGAEFSANVMAIHKRFPASHWVAETPILKPHDNRLRLMKLYGVYFVLATLAYKLGIVFETVDPQTVKMELAGRGAEKPDMVRVARKMGVILPATLVAGQYDAADAVGVWKAGVRLFARKHLSRWDEVIYSNRGGLL